MIVEFKHVSKIFEHEQGYALTDVSFSVREGEFICLVGPSGGGKSTILKLIAGITEPTSGHVYRPQRVSMVFQTAALFPWLTVLENVMLVLTAKNMREEHAKKIARMHIDTLGLSDFCDKRPADLSGGQRQRVGIARALAVDPHVLLLDEPFSALDPKTTAELHDDIIKIWKHTKKTIIMVSHVIEEAVSLSERILLIKNSKLDHEFEISLPYPRREHTEGFAFDVNRIRKEFFK
jgi:ABC-type nitrate/sulfonate/bicarbonate transport system ATPase subunit